MTAKPTPVPFRSAAPSLFSAQHGAWRDISLHLSKSAWLEELLRSGKELGLTGGSQACTWSEVWPEPAGAIGLAGSPVRTLSPELGGTGSEASRLRAGFIKRHQERRPGTAVIYLHFLLVKCY